MLLDHYEETLKEIEDLATNLDNLSNKEFHHVLLSIACRGRQQIETMFGRHEPKKYTKEEIQEHFNATLKLVSMTKVKKTNDKT